MSQRTVSTFIDELLSKATKQSYITNQTKVYEIDDTWSLDILNINDYGPEKVTGY